MFMNRLQSHTRCINRRRLSRAGITATLIGTLFACGGGSDSGGTAPPPAPPPPPAPTPGTLSISTAPVTVNAVAGTSVTINIGITRGGSFTGAVAMTIEGLPTGVTATFTPASLASGVSTSELSLTVAASVPAATTNLTLRASGTGVTTATRAMALAVTVPDPGNFALALNPAALSVTAGQSASSTVNITRSGGFTGAVSLSVEGLPNGVTAAFTPETVTGAQAQLTLTASSTATAGAFTATVRGGAIGLGGRTASLALTVQAGGGGGGGSGAVVWQFCDSRRFPLWLAYQDGSNGAWTRVVPGANQTYSFTISQNVGAVAYVQDQQGLQASVTILRSSRAELQALGAVECVNNPARKTISGTVTGLSATQVASVSVGTATAQAEAAAPAFTLNFVADVRTDLLAIRGTRNPTTFAVTPDRVLLRRNINPPAGGAVPAVDFGVTDAFAPASAQYTVANANGEQLFSSIGLFTANGPVGFVAFNDPQATGNTRTVYGLPFAQTQAGDLHQVQFIASNAAGTSARQVLQYNREIVARTVTLGPVVNDVQLSTVASAPYVRLRAAGTWQSEYDDIVTAGFSQNEGGGRIWSMQVSRAYAGLTSQTFTLEIPDLSGVEGFNNSWGLLNNTATPWTFGAIGISATGTGQAEEGYVSRAGTRNGTITP